MITVKRSKNGYLKINGKRFVIGHEVNVTLDTGNTYTGVLDNVGYNSLSISVTDKEDTEGRRNFQFDNIKDVCIA